MENLNLMEVTMERNIIKRDEENREVRVFHVVRLCEPTSTRCTYL